MRPRHPAEENRPRYFPCPNKDLSLRLRALRYFAVFAPRRQPCCGDSGEKNHYLSMR